MFAWKFRRVIITCATLALVLGLATYVFVFLKPGPDRDWAAPYQRFPKILIGDSVGKVSVIDLRDYRWTKSGEPKQRWTRETYSLAGLDGVIS